MKSSKSKIKAFTLTEMIVVLTITVIVVGLAFSVLTLVQKQMSGISATYEDTTELNLLQQALWIDFNTYPDILFDTKTATMQCSNEIEGVTYIFENDWVVRQRDTFRIKTSETIFYSEGNAILSGAVDALKLTSDKESGTKTIFIHAENPANEFMR